MKKTVGLFVLFVLVAGTASAQTVKCQQWQTAFSAYEWSMMSPELQEMACRYARDTTPRPTPPPEPPRWLSPKLVLGGIFTTAAGLGVAFHWGDDDVHFLGNTYCVSSNGDVDYGSCGSGTQTKIGLAMVGAGAAMVFIGTRHVKVSPMIGKNVKGVSASIKWGGK